ncbi:hypothetical protein J1N35_019122 [Gossypium stocksii]|uniref:Uncharacterized protein n=1 Tax=Gossypium stocksii TaxID=47602 RepID=A0A9D3VSD8_9ROSI|nr:hypothetical protein J1N35_019122 [Gossypium stocksii]
MVLEADQHRARENVPIDECVEPENVQVEKEAPYAIVEDLKIDIHQEMENGEMSEALGIIDEISDSSEF